jgi:hypothetical protein
MKGRKIFSYQIWKLRPEAKGITVNCNELDSTHTCIEKLTQEMDLASLSTESVAKIVCKHRHIERLATQLNLGAGDIVVCDGKPFMVGHFWDVRRGRLIFDSDA